MVSQDEFAWDRGTDRSANTTPLCATFTAGCCRARCTTWRAWNWNEEMAERVRQPEHGSPRRCASAAELLEEMAALRLSFEAMTNWNRRSREGNGES